MLIEASITAGIRPTSMILHTQPGKKWDEWDFLCIEAFQIARNETCQHCNMPMWICRNEDADIGFKVVEDTCFALREVEIEDEKNSNKNKYKAPKGTKARPEAVSYSKSELFTAEVREAYYKAEWEKSHPEPKPDVS